MIIKRVNWTYIYALSAILLILVLVFLLIYLVRIPFNTATEVGLFEEVSQRGHPSTVEFWTNYIGVVISSASILFVVVTLSFQFRQMLLQHKQLADVRFSSNKNFEIANNDYDAHILKLINLFLNKDMAECRKRCWLLREELKESPNMVKAELKEILKKQLRDSWGSRDEYESLQATQRFTDYSMATELLRFFDMLSYYQLSDKTAKAIHFYYVWWRGFCIDIINILNESSNEIATDMKHLSFPPNWVSMVERMDHWMAKYNLPIA